MKHLMVLVAVSILVLLISVFVAEVPSTVPAELESSKAPAVVTVQETKVTFTGVVKEISDKKLLVERTVKDKTETLEFTLDKTVEEIRVGDKVKISYIKKEGKYIATRVTLFIEKRIIKKTSQAKEANQKAY